MEEKTKKCVIILSGGMDSTTLLYKMKEEYEGEIYPMNINYGQRHSMEIKMAEDTCKKLDLKFKYLDLRHIGKSIASNSSLTDPFRQVPKGHYEDESMKQTVVPNRNMMLLSMATAYAIDIGADEVYYGAHSGDHAIYPDCRPDFYEALGKTMELCHYTPVKLKAPFMKMTKADIVALGLTLDVDYSMTWTCYDPVRLQKRDPITNAINYYYVSCGKCGSCSERLEAFKLNEVNDMIEYAK